MKMKNAHAAYDAAVDEARAAYDAAVDEARVTYEIIFAASERTCDAAIEAACDAYDAVRKTAENDDADNAAWEACTEECKKARKIRDDAIDEARAAYDAVRDTAEKSLNEALDRAAKLYLRE